ncbi:MAG TPA: hypothetical protein VM510_17035, partial [Caulifigura sp.]|nr:hypothetical protein [Caulifigura sp.]
MNRTGLLPRRLLLLASYAMLWSAACSREQKPVPLPPSGLSDKEAAALPEEASETAVEPDSDG